MVFQQLDIDSINDMNVEIISDSLIYNDFSDDIYNENLLIAGGIGDIFKSIFGIVKPLIGPLTSLLGLTKNKKIAKILPKIKEISTVAKDILPEQYQKYQQYLPRPYIDPSQYPQYQQYGQYGPPRRHLGRQQQYGYGDKFPLMNYKIQKHDYTPEGYKQMQENLNKKYAKYEKKIIGPPDAIWNKKKYSTGLMTDEILKTLKAKKPRKKVFKMKFV